MQSTNRTNSLYSGFIKQNKTTKKKNQQLSHLKYCHLQIQTLTSTATTGVCDKDRGDTRDPFLDFHC